MSENREYIKSYSNFVLKKKHQDVNSGNVFERDITTIGGLNQFSPGQIPMYKSSNFIITVNNEITPSKTIDEDKFEEWTLQEINQNDVEELDKDSLQIVLKQDFYKLRDFAYFGSCTELIRASILNIISKFPGELYVPKVNNSGIPVYYTDINGEMKRLGGNENLILVDNPSNINIHTEYINKDLVENPLKYLCNEGYKNYNVTSWKVNKESKDCFNKGDLIATVTIDGKTLYAYKGDEGKIIYLTKGNLDTSIIRPKTEFFNKFYKELDTFEKILLNPKSTPKYTALFEVMREKEYGYETELKSFTFPTTYGDYNLAFYGPSYESYVQELYHYAEFYDETFCDNLYRSMTHESIKNLDWSFTREYQEGDEKEYSLGGDKIKKLIHLFGREFDEIKYYIDGIKNYKSISYGENSLLPDYFLTDELANDGWDVLNIFPYNNELKQIEKNENPLRPYSVNNFTDENDKNGYFVLCTKCASKEGEDGTLEIEKIKDNEKNKLFEIDCSNTLRNRIRPYSSEREYTYNEINNHFLKMLKLNSKSILRKKGTIEGIESLLALFGLKSDRMCKGEKETEGVKNYDYKIIEYTSSGDTIIDEYNTEHKKLPIDWYNSTKTLVYNTDSFRNGIYEPYQGLPIRGYIKNGYRYININKFSKDSLYNTLEKSDNKNVYLYPYFSYNKLIDGNPYYQMNGGWMKKNYMFDKENNLFSTSGINNSFTETYKTVKSVNTIKDLVQIPKSALKTNDIYHINYVIYDYAVLDGNIYDIFNDSIGNKYVKFNVSNGKIKIGKKTFEKDFYASYPKDGNDYIIKQYNLDLFKNNSELRVYIVRIDNEDSLVAYGNYYGVNNVNIVLKPSEEDETNERKEVSENEYYYQLKDVYNKNKIGGRGWVKFRNNDIKLKLIKNVRDKFKGNNPHKGNSVYDYGNEYMMMFAQLFKYALDNDAFNEDCYGEGFNAAITDIKTKGFSGITNDITDFSYNINEDTKIHSFMRQTEVNEDKESKKLTNENNNKDTLIYDNGDYENLTINDGITDNIINTKRTKIEFVSKNEIKPSYLKHIDSSVLNYTEQLLPSTLITEVQYPSVDFENKTYDYRLDVISYTIEPCKTMPIINANYIITEKGNPDPTIIPLTTKDLTLIGTDLDFGNKKGGSYKFKVKYENAIYPKKDGEFIELTQEPCTNDITVDVYEYKLEVTKEEIHIGACDTDKYVFEVKGYSKKKDDETEYSNEIILSEDDYMITLKKDNVIVDEITPNNSSDEIEYNVTIKGIRDEYSSSNCTLNDLKIIQEAGPCGCDDRYEVTDNSNIEIEVSTYKKCDFKPNIKVYATNLKHIFSDCSVKENIRKKLIEGDEYELTSNPPFRKNDTDNKKEYTITVNGKENTIYSGLRGETNITQEAGPCEITYEVSYDYSKAKLEFTCMPIDKCANNANISVINKDNFNIKDVKYTDEDGNEKIIALSINKDSIAEGMLSVSFNPQVNEKVSFDKIDNIEVTAVLENVKINNGEIIYGDGEGVEYTITGTSHTFQNEGICCECTINNVTISSEKEGTYNNSLTFTYPNEGNHTFWVNIDSESNGSTEGCCSNKFDVLKDGTVYKYSLENSFELPNGSGEYIIRSVSDNTKTANLTVIGKIPCKCEIYDINVSNDKFIGEGKNKKYTYTSVNDNPTFEVSVNGNNDPCCNYDFMVKCGDTPIFDDSKSEKFNLPYLEAKKLNGKGTDEVTITVESLFDSSISDSFIINKAFNACIEHDIFHDGTYLEFKSTNIGKCADKNTEISDVVIKNINHQSSATCEVSTVEYGVTDKKQYSILGYSITKDGKILQIKDNKTPQELINNEYVSRTIYAHIGLNKDFEPINENTTYNEDSFDSKEHSKLIKGVVNITQEAGPCGCEERYEYDDASLIVKANNVKKCDTSTPIVVTVNNVVHYTKDCQSPVISITLANTEYELIEEETSTGLTLGMGNLTFSENNTTNDITYTVKVKPTDKFYEKYKVGKGVKQPSLRGETTFKQDYGPCKCEERYEYDDSSLMIKVNNVGKCDTSTPIEVIVNNVVHNYEDCERKAISITLANTEYELIEEETSTGLTLGMGNLTFSENNTTNDITYTVKVKPTDKFYEKYKVGKDVKQPSLRGETTFKQISGPCFYCNVDSITLRHSNWSPSTVVFTSDNRVDCPHNAGTAGWVTLFDLSDYKLSGVNGASCGGITYEVRNPSARDLKVDKVGSTFRAYIPSATPGNRYTVDIVFKPDSNLANESRTIKIMCIIYKNN